MLGSTLNEHPSGHGRRAWYTEPRCAGSSNDHESPATPCRRHQTCQWTEAAQPVVSRDQSSLNDAELSASTAGTEKKKFGGRSGATGPVDSPVVLPMALTARTRNSCVSYLSSLLMVTKPLTSLAVTRHCERLWVRISTCRPASAAHPVLRNAGNSNTVSWHPSAGRTTGVSGFSGSSVVDVVVTDFGARLQRVHCASPRVLHQAWYLVPGRRPVTLATHFPAFDAPERPPLPGFCGAD
eukprot:4981309-Prymnesium_polylepis.2